MIHLEDVFVVFNQGTPLEKIALKNIHLNINNGDIVTLVGNSGSGKTTLLKLLSGHIYPTFGKMFLDKIDITSHNLYEKTKYFASVLTCNGFDVIYDMTIAENLMLAKLHHGKPKYSSKALTANVLDEFFDFLAALDFFKIQYLMNVKVGNLPKAYIQVVALCMAAVQKPKVMLIDEHLHGIEKDVANHLLEVTKKIIAIENTTTIIAIDDPTLGLSFGNRTVVLHHGHIQLDLSEQKRKEIMIENVFDSEFTLSNDENASQNFHFIPDTLHPLPSDENGSYQKTDEQIQRQAENVLDEFKESRGEKI